MKSPVLSLLLILVFSLSALAAPRHPRHLRRAHHHLGGVSDVEPATPNATPELADRAAQTSVYYADALRLNYSQTLTVRKAALRLLQEQEQNQDTTQLGQQMRFESTLLRVLTPGQYSAFRLLVNHQPGDDNPPVATR